MRNESAMIGFEKIGKAVSGRGIGSGESSSTLAVRL